ncbi:hypothetical protein [uncultured Clostridium sp.]|nr:hypothetical protein [uncultured Clostridium sp.]
MITLLPMHLGITLIGAAAIARNIVLLNIINHPFFLKFTFMIYLIY